ncbi:hypothetical protein DdX_14093 [Ditylenchus destructor]|uniref:Uncharacterized protein n=1 Tax=Ditylenchus destructor TaxID=166010 RepID=A0AAD4MRS9_9BILA|nr:hypothetical protein DdX_14093 [Ditylenchus destructor]
MFKQVYAIIAIVGICNVMVCVAPETNHGTTGERKGNTPEEEAENLKKIREVGRDLLRRTNSIHGELQDRKMSKMNLLTLKAFEKQNEAA